MPKLILHIGTHKTGTSSIQDIFFANRDLLWEKGVYYPDMDRNYTGHHGLVTPWIRLPEIFHLKVAPRTMWRNIAEYGLEHDKTVFLSSEEFSRGGKHRVDFTEIREFFRDYDEIEVMCTLRDQVSYIQSIYLEVGKTKKMPPWSDFLKEALRTYTATGLFLDYNDLDAFLTKSFDPSEITYVSFSQASGRSGIVEVYLNKLGINYQEFLDDAQLEQKSNVSPEPLVYFLANTLAGDQMPTYQHIKEARKQLKAKGIELKNTSIYSKEEFLTASRYFDEKNQMFLNRISENLESDFFEMRISAQSVFAGTV